MLLTRYLAVAACLSLTLLSGCGGFPVYSNPEKLVIYPDGSMEFRNHPIPKQDVVLYPDGYGGEKAAVRVHMEPPCTRTSSGIRLWLNGSGCRLPKQK